MKRPLLLTCTFAAGIVIAATGAAIPAAADLGDIITTPGVTVETPIITVEAPPVTVGVPTLPDPTPTPTDPAPTPTNPDPSPTTGPAPTSPASPAPSAPTTPAAQPTPGTAAAPAATSGTGGATSGTGGTLTPSPTAAPGATAGATPANLTATGPDGLPVQSPLDAAATTPTATTPLPAGAPPTALSPVASVPATSVPADPSQPALPAPAAAGSDSASDSRTWPLLVLGALLLAGLVALAVRRGAAGALLGGMAARRRQPARPVLVATPPATRLEQCDLRWRRGLLRARFEAVATTPDGETRIGTSARYWAVRDRRTATAGLAYLGLLQALREAGWHDAPATSLWYRAPRLGPGGQWYARRLERGLPGGRSVVAQLDRRDADVAVGRAG